MNKKEHEEINKFNPTSVKLAPAPQKRCLKNVFLAAGLSAIIHSGLLLGVYCQASENTTPEHPGQAGLEIEIDLRALKPKNLARTQTQTQAPINNQISAKRKTQSSSAPRAEHTKQSTPAALASANQGLTPQTSGSEQQHSSSAPTNNGIAGNNENSQSARGSSSAMDSSPKIIANPKPSYPPLARQRGQEGLVLLIVQVNEKGQPGPIKVKTSSGYPMLDQAALKGIQKWKFQPASLAGLPMAGSVLVPVEFKLQD